MICTFIKLYVSTHAQNDTRRNGPPVTDKRRFQISYRKAEIAKCNAIEN